MGIISIATSNNSDQFPSLFLQLLRLSLSNPVLQDANYTHYTLYRSCLFIDRIAIIRSLSFLFLDDFEGNANIPVAIKSISTVLFAFIVLIRTDSPLFSRHVFRDAPAQVYVDNVHQSPTSPVTNLGKHESRENVSLSVHIQERGGYEDPGSTPSGGRWSILPCQTGWCDTEILDVQRENIF